jgi:hypothetical protein
MRTVELNICAYMPTIIAGGKRQSKQPGFPFTKIQGQDDMKLALLLNVVDPNIGGALIMGDRGCGKSVAVSASISLISTPKEGGGSALLLDKAELGVASVVCN